MGNKGNYANWNNGCDQGCQEEVITVGCGCEADNDCGCAAPAETTCSKCGKKVSHHGGCGCSNADGAHIWFEACDGYKEIDVTTTCQQAENWGRVLDVNCTLQNVCPGRRSALGMSLMEVDGNGAEYARGFQAITVPAHHGRCNQDITVDTVRFVLPEEGCTQQRRHFVVRTQHHYLDAGSIWNNSWGN